MFSRSVKCKKKKRYSNVQPAWIKPSFYKYGKLLRCELETKTLTNTGGDELQASVLLSSGYVRMVTVLILF